MLFLCVVPVLASAQSIGAAEFPAASLAGNEFQKAVEPDWWLDYEKDRPHALAHVRTTAPLGAEQHVKHRISQDRAFILVSSS